jgi:hypothetical protein
MKRSIFQSNTMSRVYIEARNVLIALKYGKQPFITFQQLTEDTVEFAKQIPNIYDVIVGIPRSGMIPVRARVPKMVKNDFNSGLPVSPVFEEDKIPKEIKNRYEAQSRP